MHQSLLHDFVPDKLLAFGFTLAVTVGPLSVQLSRSTPGQPRSRPGLPRSRPGPSRPRPGPSRPRPGPSRPRPGPSRPRLKNLSLKPRHGLEDYITGGKPAQCKLSLLINRSVKLPITANKCLSTYLSPYVSMCVSVSM